MSTPQAKLHATFLTRLIELQSVVTGQATSFRDGGVRPWNVPAVLHTPLTPTAITPAFDRGEINTNYMTTESTNGTVGDLVSLQLQLACVSSEERAFRLRQASPCRTLAHAHARLLGHGHAAGIFGRIQQAAAAPIKANN